MCASLISLVCKLFSSATTRWSLCFRSLFLRVYYPTFYSTSLQNSYNNVDVQFIYSSLLIRSSSNALIGYISTLRLGWSIDNSSKIQRSKFSAQSSACVHKAILKAAQLSSFYLCQVRAFTQFIFPKLYIIQKLYQDRTLDYYAYQVVNAFVDIKYSRALWLDKTLIVYRVPLRCRRQCQKLEIIASISLLQIGQLSSTPVMVWEQQATRCHSPLDCF